MIAPRTLSVVVGLLWTCVTVAQAGSVVKTPSGSLRGATTADLDVTMFKGVRYAQPPVGDLRWKAPIPAPSWKGIIDARKFGASCPQVLRHSSPPFTEEFMEQGIPNEDCLFLNIWIPKHAGKHLPVVVFFHGGSFSEGSGDISAYDGSALSSQGVIVITINYRLGALGYLALTELSAENPDHISGNYGLLDQIEALRWVKRNISSFGGDPNAVTIMGQSAGARSVQVLLASPKAQGLFRSAIAESGISVAGSSHWQTLPQAEQQGLKFMESAGVSSVKQLRLLSADEIVQLQAKVNPSHLIIDEKLVPECVAGQETGCHLGVPLLTGWNSDEQSASENYGKLTMESYRGFAQKTYGNYAEQFLTLYPAHTDAEANRSFVQSARDKNAVGLKLWIERQTKSEKAKVFTYFFDRQIPWKAHPEFAAHHTGEIPYVFGNLTRVKRDYGAKDTETSRIMVQYWVNFIRSGDPNGQGVPPWTPYEMVSPKTQEIGERVGSLPVPQPDLQKWWAGLLH